MKLFFNSMALVFFAALALAVLSCGGGSDSIPIPYSAPSGGNGSGGGSGGTGGSSLSDFVKVVGATISGQIGDENAIGYENSSKVFITGRTVTIKNMRVCVHEVTQKEYESYCEYGSASSGFYPSDFYGKGDDYPAYYVSWYDALVYCNLRSIAENLEPVYSIGGYENPAQWPDIVSVTADGKTRYCGPSSDSDSWNGAVFNTSANGYRLPTVAEREYVASEGNNGIPTPLKLYSGSDSIDEVAWHDGNSGEKAHEIKKKKANALGIYDMSGNVSEWVWDWGGTVSKTTPAAGPQSGTNKFYRGGSYAEGEDACCVRYDAQIICKPKYRGRAVGFRVVRNAE